MRKLWRFEFIGEDGLDAGGLKREWFHLVTSEIFDPDMGFWLPSETNQMCMAINPASSKCRVGRQKTQDLVALACRNGVFQSHTDSLLYRTIQN